MNKYLILYYIYIKIKKININSEVNNEKLNGVFYSLTK